MTVEVTSLATAAPLALAAVGVVEPRPQRLPSALAYRLSRLAARAHAFHRFAHHPLCTAYAPEVLRIGRRVHVCAGCTWAAAGSALGLLLAAATPRAWMALSCALGAQILGLAALFTSARQHAQTYKWLLRAGPMLLLAWGVMQVVCCGATFGLPAWVIGAEGALAAVGWCAQHRYRRRPPWRLPCMTCPQRQDAVCDGFRRVVQRERALHRASSTLIERQMAAQPSRLPPWLSEKGR